MFIWEEKETKRDRLTHPEDAAGVLIARASVANSTPTATAHSTATLRHKRLTVAWGVLHRFLLDQPLVHRPQGNHRDEQQPLADDQPSIDTRPEAVERADQSVAIQ